MFARCLTSAIKLVQRQQSSIFSGVRTIYSSTMMGIDNFAQLRELQIEQNRDVAERFRTKMGEFVDPSSTNLVFTEDLKLMLYTAGNEKDDLMLLEKMMKKFHNQNKELRFGTFAFGPVVMRLYTLFNLPYEALKLFKDPDLNGFFDQITSFVLLSDLLFKNEMYEEVLEVYKIIQEKQIQNMRFPKNLTTVVFAALYKLNTPEAYEKCIGFIKEMDEAGHQMVRRAVCFAAKLAMNQNKPDIAKELLGRIRGQNYITVKNLQILALANLGRSDDALPLLRSEIDNDVPSRSRDQGGVFLQEVIDRLEEEIVKLDQKEVTIEFNRIKEILNQHALVQDKSLDSFLLSEINITPSTPEKPFFQGGFNTRNPQDGKYQDRGFSPRGRDSYDRRGNFDRRDNYDRRDSYDRRDNFDRRSRDQRPNRPGLRDLV